MRLLRRTEGSQANPRLEPTHERPRHAATREAQDVVLPGRRRVTQSWWTVRGGGFDLSEVPNSKHLDNSFGQFSLIGELEERHELFGHPGKLKVLGFVNRGRMAD